MRLSRRLLLYVFAASTLAAASPAQTAPGLQVADYQRLRAAAQAEFSPDGKLVAYTVLRYDRPGRPWPQLWVLDVATGKSARIGAEDQAAGNPVWSPDGRWIAYFGDAEGKHGLVIAHPDGSAATFLAEGSGTNAPLPAQGAEVTWSPDSKQIAFVSATPGPETADATGDPIVITRYLYKPDAGEGNTHFNDNRRLHIFVVDVATSRCASSPTAPTTSIRSTGRRNGDEIAFISNREPETISSSTTTCSR